MTDKPRSPQRRRRQAPPSPRPHGWSRADDQSDSATRMLSLPRRTAPAGTSLLLTLIVGVMTAIGIVRVHASTRVLELGAEITELTAEQSELLEQKRRLAAERAYLRHPEHIEEVARERLQMVPIAPDLVQTIRLVDPAPPVSKEPVP